MPSLVDCPKLQSPDELEKVVQAYNSLLDDSSLEIDTSYCDELTGTPIYISHNSKEWEAMRCDTPEEAKPIRSWVADAGTPA